MGILNWLFGKHDNAKLAEQARTIDTLQQEVEVLRRQEEMNLGNREEINRLHRELNALKYPNGEQSTEALIDEADRRRSMGIPDTPKQISPDQQRINSHFRQRQPSQSTSRRSNPAYPQTSSPNDFLTGAVIGTIIGSPIADTSCPTPSDSGSSSSSSDGGSCDSGGGF